jgi:hypothetical protein
VRDSELSNLLKQHNKPGQSCCFKNKFTTDKTLSEPDIFHQ